MNQNNAWRGAMAGGSQMRAGARTQNMPRPGPQRPGVGVQARQQPAAQEGTVRDGVMFINRYLGMAQTFGTLDNAVVTNTLQKCCRTPMEESAISMETALYAARYLPIFMAGLVLDEDGLRGLCEECISTEASLDDVPAEARAQARRQMRTVEAMPSTPSSCMYIGSTCFSYSVMSMFFDMAGKNFSALDGTALSRAVDMAVGRYTPEDRARVGRILSAFPYLMRAMNQNPEFQYAVRRTLDGVCRKYNVAAKK